VRLFTRRGYDWTDPRPGEWSIVAVSIVSARLGLPAVEGIGEKEGSQPR